MSDRPRRRLAAIVAADVANYSRLIGLDEEGTLKCIRDVRRDIVSPLLNEYGGRIANTAGDSLLLEFSSVVDAVRCALAIQLAMAERNAGEPVERRLVFRVGINVGDVVSEGDDLLGDGVNVAARLEGLAEAGGIALSDDAYRQIRDRVDISWSDAGEHELKNIARPVRVWRWLPDQTETKPPAPAAPGFRPMQQDKPSIAVLPFANMSGDPEQEFFVDGLTEDIITELSRRHELFVISRNSSFTYKGQAVNLREIAQKLGAQYLVEGSVRKAGERLRVTVQLIDSDNDSHIWAEKYDRKLDDIFEIQDEVTSAIVATLPGRVEAAQHDRMARKTPANMASYECVLAAKVRHHRSTIEDNVEAQKLIDRALQLDPDYAHALAWRGCILGQAWVYGWCEDREATWDALVADLGRALSLDDNDADVHRILAAINIGSNDLTKARYHQERALALNPNYDLVVVQQGELLTWLGHPEEGIEWIRKAMRLNPHHPERFWSHLGKAHFTARRYGEAIEAFMHLSAMDHTHHAILAAAHALLGDDVAASAHVARIYKLEPDFDLETYLSTLHYRDEADLQHHREGVVKAGVKSSSDGPRKPNLVE